MTQDHLTPIPEPETEPDTGHPGFDIRDRRPSFWQNISVVWLVPVLALAISLGIAWQNYSHRGELIEIAFANASGVEAGKTAIKYRDVSVGLVESVTFSPDLSKVLVRARVDQNVVPYLDDDASFWVVRPQVSVRGISGLDTVLSGVFIEGSWNSEPGDPRNRFTGESEPPLARADERGTRVVLRVKDGNQLAAGAPILHKGVQVGHIETPRLSPAGDAVTVNAFIEAPHDARMTTLTRFWDTSGFSVSLGTGGVTLDVNSLASLVEGGIGFDTVVSGGEAVEPGHVFDVYDGEATARESLFTDPSADPLLVSAYFDGSVSGLTTGAEVRYRGITVGAVRDLLAQAVPGPDGTRTIRMLTTLAIEPGKLGLQKGATPADALALVTEQVSLGLKARLATGNILTGSLFVELAEVPDPPAALDPAGQPYPVLPVAESQIADFNATAEGVFERINALPIEELLSSAIRLMDSAEALVASDRTQALPQDLSALLDEARALVGSEDAQAVPGELRATVTELRGILESLHSAGTVDKLNDVIARAATAAEAIETASADFPEITAQIKALGEKANSLDVDELVASANATLKSVEALIDTDGARALPPALTGALDEMRAFLGEVREGGAIGSVNEAIGSARSAAEAVEAAAESLPALSDRLNRLIADASGVVDGYGARSRFNAETLAALRDIRAAADAVAGLARTIQRNPNMLLLGR